MISQLCNDVALGLGIRVGSGNTGCALLGHGSCYRNIRMPIGGGAGVADLGGNFLGHTYLLSIADL
eukprot:5245527-Amphidinium_carterae.1